VVRTRVGNLAEIKPLSNLDLCWGEGNNATVVLKPCSALLDQTWLIVREIGLRNAWTVELYGRYLACKQVPVKLSTAVWSKNQAFIIQFPPHEAHTEGLRQPLQGSFAKAA
jgi:hypothetical protein